MEELHRDSGIINKSQVRSAIARGFLENTHFVSIDGTLYVTEIVYKILMLSFRSKKGASLLNMGDVIKVPTEELYQYEKRKRANTRTPKRYDNPDQQKLFDLEQYN